MTSKDPNFISNKLSELKRTALQQNVEGQRMANPVMTTQYISRPVTQTDWDDNKRVTYSVSRPNLGGSVLEEEITTTRVKKEYPAQPTTITLEDYKRKLEGESYLGSGQKDIYRLDDPLRRLETSPPKVSYKSYTTTPVTNAYRTTIDEPRVVKARNIQTPTVNTVYDGYSNNYSGTNATYLGTNPRPAHSYSVDKFKTSLPVNTYDTFGLKNLGKPSQTERYKVNMAEDLNVRLQECSDINRKLTGEVDQLKRALEAERAKTTEIDHMCREDFEEVKHREQEVRKEWETMEDRHQEKIHMIKKYEDQSYNLRTALDKARHENELLKNELKRLGEMTSEKVLDLENNINSIARMKEFENDNFEMEKEKVGNTCEFVIEQMKAHFTERAQKVDESSKKLHMEQQRIESEIKLLSDELRAFNSNADQKIKTIMNLAIEEEQNRQNREVNEVKSQIRAEEDEIARVTRRNQEHLQKFQNIEREGKNKLISKKNENTRLKEDLANLEQQYNKLVIQLNNEKKEIDKKKANTIRLESELSDIKDKAETLEMKYNQEVEALLSEHNDDIRELENNYAFYQDEQQRLAEAIREETSKIYELARKQQELIHAIENNLNSTINQHMGAESNKTVKNGDLLNTRYKY